MRRIAIRLMRSFGCGGAILYLLMGSLAAQEGNHASIEFRVTDAYLQGLPYRVSSLVSKDSKREYRDRFGETLRADHLPYGSYSYILVRRDVAKPGATTIRGEIWVDRAQVFIPLTPTELNLKVLGGREAYVTYPRVERRVLGHFDKLPPSAKDFWVRVEFVPVTHIRNFRVTSNGDFEFEAAAGNYVLTLIGGGMVLHSVPFVLGGGTEESKLRLTCCNALDLRKR